MYSRIQSRLKKLINQQQAASIKGGLKGIEKESLRVSKAGKIAQTVHPHGLGSALTNPYITTDYSEALLEFITPPFSDTSQALSFMHDLHGYTYQQLDDELLWSASMPCIVDGELSIPIAQYGSSNIGKMKHIYRQGLWHRYGRKMQAISGIHFNYSLPEDFWPIYQQMEGSTLELTDFISQSYFDMTRNLHRYGWVVLYLFGASPAICKSFLDDEDNKFEEFDRGTLFQPFATSLRMSDIGYKNDSQSNINISYNGLNEYVERLNKATKTPYHDYELIGLKDKQGDYKQLNTNILQIENEYYSNVRPKQIAKSGERPSAALKSRGVRYVELRSVDLGIYDPAGCNEQQLRFLEAFMIFCLLSDSPKLSPEGKRRVDKNLTLVASNGRENGLKLHREGGHITLKNWGFEICTEMLSLCEILDTGNDDKPFTKALAAQQEKFAQVDLTPSAQILQSMHEQKLPFFKMAMQQSTKHQSFFQNRKLSSNQQQLLEHATKQSFTEQQQIEKQDTLSFESFLSHYFNQ